MTHAAVAWTAWMLFLASWWVAAWWTARAVSRGAAGARLAYYAGFAIGFTLLFAGPRLVPGLAAPLWRVGTAGAVMLIAAELAAFAFGWWARLHLGRLWSGMLTLREGHRVVESGPYGVVRHPIYTAFIAAAWAYAVLRGAPATLGGALVLTIVMTVKAWREEALLRRELGAAAYDAYAARVPMIVPFARRRVRPAASHP